MRMTLEQFNKIQSILTKTISKEPTGWSVIVEAVKKEMAIKNFMTVRGVLQSLLDENKIKRTDSVKEEKYYSL